MHSRRRFLKSTSVVVGGVAAFPHVASSAEKLWLKTGQKPRHIIHMVADGMSLGTLTGGDHLSALLRQRNLTWMQLYLRPETRTGLMNMRSLNSLVTDSSAASSSWGSGTRIINGMVNQLGNGAPLKTLYELFQETGWKRALVTTTEITHATPAGFAACVPDRDDAETIAVQYLERTVDVLLGGGRKFFNPNERKDKRDLKWDFQKAGYVTMETRDELLRAPGTARWLGTFDSSHLPFTVDQRQSASLQKEVPTLAEMTLAALRKLETENHFILQVEGGRVDHGCHNCDAAAALYEMIAFDEAIDVCREFQDRHPDTLLVITTDHGNGNLGLNGTGSAYGQSDRLFANLLHVRASFPEIIKRFDIRDAGAEGGGKRKANPQEIRQIMRETTGFHPSESQAELFAPFVSEKGRCVYGFMNGEKQQLGQLMGNYLGIGWAGNAHTADYVALLALGPGSERFSGFVQNIDVFRHYLAFGNIEFQNPSEPLLSHAGPDASEAERWRDYMLA